MFVVRRPDQYRSFDFMRECLSNRSRLVDAIATYGICYGRCDSFLSHNALYCANKFKMNICDIVSEMKVECAVLRETGSGTAEAYGWLCPRIVVHTRRSLSSFELCQFYTRRNRNIY